MSSTTVYRLLWGLAIASLVYTAVVILHSSRETAQARQIMQAQEPPAHADRIDRFIEETSQTLGR